LICLKKIAKHFFPFTLCGIFFFPIKPCKSESITKNQRYTFKDLDFYGIAYKDKAGGSLKEIENIFRYFFSRYSKEDSKLSFQEFTDLEEKKDAEFTKDFPQFNRSKFSKDVIAYTNKKMNELRKKNFNNLDSDQNGTLSFNEFYGKRLENLKNLDLDGNSILSVVEIENSFTRKKTFKILNEFNNKMKKTQEIIDDSTAKLKESNKGLSESIANYKKNIEKINKGINRVESLGNKNRKTLKISPKH